MKRIQDYSAQEIFEILNDSDECNWLEAKGAEDVRHDSGRENFRTLQETVCSFCNEPGLGGGVIIYGVGENRDEHSVRYHVEGIPNPDKAQLDIATQCKTLFNIAVHPQIRVERIDDKKVLVIYVPELPERRKPLYFKKDGFLVAHIGGLAARICAAPNMTCVISMRIQHPAMIRFQFREPPSRTLLRRPSSVTAPCGSE